MRLVRNVIVFDAADLPAESAFWAGMLGGHVFADDGWHSVLDAAGEWRIGVQLAPNHVPPDWPNGSPQQVHLDLHVDDPRAAHDEALALGARLLQSAPDLDSDEGFQVYADPAGHPFCIGWGQPSPEALAAFVVSRLTGRALRQTRSAGERCVELVLTPGANWGRPSRSAASETRGGSSAAQAMPRSSADRRNRSIPDGS